MNDQLMDIIEEKKKMLIVKLKWNIVVFCFHRFRNFYLFKGEE